MKDSIKTLRGLGALVIAGAAALGAMGCQGGGEKEAGGGASALFGDWRMTSLGEARAESLVPRDARTPSLSIGEDGSVSGFTGVNNLSGSIELDGLAKGAFALSPLATTRMAGPPELMDLERRYLDALHGASKFEVEGDSLSLSGAGARLIGFVRGR